MKKLALLWILAVGLFISFQQNIFACSCGPTPTVLAEFEMSKDVLIAKITSIEKAKPNSSKKHLYGIAGVKMTVEKVYKGNLKIGDELFFRQGGGADCIWAYAEESVGSELLIYSDLDKKSKKNVGSVCGRSRTAKFANDDLLYLNNLEKVRGKSRISGTLLYSQESAVKGKADIYRRVAGKKVKIISKNTSKVYEVISDENGVYEIYDLPKGRYYIEPELPKGWKIDNFMSEAFDYTYWDELEKKAKKNKGKLEDFELPQEDENDENRFYLDLVTNRHSGLNFDFELDNKIIGFVLSPSGQPMEDVCVSAIPTKDEKEKNFNASDCTDKNGKFLIDDAPPGDYYLVSNEDGEMNFSHPFRTLYYPGVFERNNAKTISLGEGEIIDSLQIQVPTVEEVITLEGKFLYSDGKPVVDKSVNFKPNNQQTGINGKSYTKTDEQGRFKIKILKGQKGILFGGMSYYVTDFKDCPILGKLAKYKTLKFDYHDLTTPKVEINAVENMKDIVLTFPFPSCQKSK